jgi:hypothetical protein
MLNAFDSRSSLYYATKFQPAFFAASTKFPTVDIVGQSARSPEYSATTSVHNMYTLGSKKACPAGIGVGPYITQYFRLWTNLQ